MQVQRWLKALLVGWFIAMLLSSCCSSNPLDQGICRPPKPSTIDFYKALQKQGVDIIQTGETITIVLPSDRLFNPDSANFSSNANAIISPLVELMRGYEVVFMHVSGFTDNCGSANRNQALSEQQAQQVAAALTAANIDTRIVYAVGYGAARPIATNETPQGQAQNRRIEIRFRYVVIPPLS